jgi:hypothetical protein
VFAAFKSIEPGTESELVLKYTLPAGVAAQWQAGKYTMVWQKQPGMVRPTIDVTFNAPKAIGTFEGVDNKGKISKNSAQFEGLLDHDRTIIVHTK